MATVTKPIALDESLNTTELSSRNVADVLAQELSAVATAIGGIAVPSADHVSYDNSVSGLSATDVQNALDEIVSDIPTVNNGTLTIQQNGTSIGSFSANTASNVTANIKTPTADKKTATDEFSTADGGLLSKCQINLVPVQSGSGDPSPDNVRPISGHTEVDLQVDGKNILDPTNFRSSFTSGTVQITKIEGNHYRFNGTVSSTSWVKLISNSNDQIALNEPTGTYTLSTSNSKINNYIFRGDGFTDYVYGGGKITSTNKPITGIGFIIAQGTVFNDEDVYFQLEKGNQKTAYEPYLGHLYQVQIGSTVYGGYVDLVSGVMTINRASVDLGTLTWEKRDLATLDVGYYFQCDISTKTKSPSDNITTNYRVAPYGSITALIQAEGSNVDKVAVDAGADTNFRIIDSSYSDENTFKTAMLGVMLVYKLATPQTIQLTPQQIETLAGQNNLSTPLDGQSIETNGVEYKELFTFADVKEYVDKKIPDAPTTDGTYTLQAVVSGGVPTYSWV